MTLRILSASEVRSALPMAEAIDAMREAFGAFAAGRVALPPRTHLRLPGADLSTLTMPGAMTGPERVGAKLLTLHPGNPARSLPAIRGVVTMFDPDTGAPAGLLDGTAITALRAGAVCGLATDLLASPEASVLGVIGSGVQARAQVEAVRCVRSIARVRIWSRTPAHARRLADALSATGVDATAVAAAAEAVEAADVICTATPSNRPLVGLAEVAAGVHVNAVGSYTRDMRELGPHLVRAARVVVDAIDAAMEEAGELIHAVEEGLVDPDNIVELGELVIGRDPGRAWPDEITLFKSVGLAVQDLAAAGRALERASALGIGTEVEIEV